ncbi:MAG: hypothetical protein NT142_12050 [Planctomycetota bacterium]|nr:hypothetical protein [Planctomycetota bacterium]
MIERLEECESISRALVAQTQWHEILAVAQSPDLKVILSNTTEWPLKGQVPIAGTALRVLRTIGT